MFSSWLNATAEKVKQASSRAAEHAAQAVKDISAASVDTAKNNNINRIDVPPQSQQSSAPPLSESTSGQLSEKVSPVKYSESTFPPTESMILDNESPAVETSSSSSSRSYRNSRSGSGSGIANSSSSSSNDEKNKRASLSWDLGDQMRDIVSSIKNIDSLFSVSAGGNNESDDNSNLIKINENMLVVNAQDKRAASIALEQQHRYLKSKKLIQQTVGSDFVISQDTAWTHVKATNVKLVQKGRKIDRDLKKVLVRGTTQRRDMKIFQQEISKMPSVQKDIETLKQSVAKVLEKIHRVHDSMERLEAAKLKHEHAKWAAGAIDELDRYKKQKGVDLMEIRRTHDVNLIEKEQQKQKQKQKQRERARENHLSQSGETQGSVESALVKKASVWWNATTSSPSASALTTRIASSADAAKESVRRLSGKALDLSSSSSSREEPAQRVSAKFDCADSDDDRWFDSSTAALGVDETSNADLKVENENTTTENEDVQSLPRSEIYITLHYTCVTLQ